MKRILLLTAVLISSIAFAQVPQGISYQAIAMNGTSPVASSNVGVKLSILDGSASGTLVYAETHVKLTNAQGLFNLTIGFGTPASGTFSGINWATGSKFLKVEMDIAGGTNYALVGTTQLLSAPYAMVADALVLSAGEGIVLTSPNGTPYTLSVNNAGQLSLPTSGSSTSIPSTLYLFGSYNSFNPTTSQLMANNGDYFFGMRYFTSGDQVKFTAANTVGATVFGTDGNNFVIPNESAYTIPSTGYYYISVAHFNNEMYLEYIDPAVPYLTTNDNGSTVYANPTYNVATNKFSFVVNGVTSTNQSTFYFGIPNPDNSAYGDSLNDGTIDQNGAAISFPGLTTTPKNFRVDIVLNFNGSGTYTITQI